jgi:hypothetical protein
LYSSNFRRSVHYISDPVRNIVNAQLRHSLQGEGEFVGSLFH